MNNEDRLRLIRALVDVRKCLQHVAARCELSVGEFMVLRRIKVESEGGESGLSGFKAAMISKGLSMPPPAASRIFNSLEKRELIERTINRENRRSVIISLTKNGQAALENAEKKVNAFLDKLILDLGENELNQFLALLEKIVDIFSSDDPLI